MSETMQENLPISADLLEILRDPYAVQHPEQYGPDPGRLELVRNSWLVSKDTGYKYPIKDGIPVMLIEEGERWKDTAVDDLPVPPETADPAPAGDAFDTPFTPPAAQSGNTPYIIMGAILGLVFIMGLILLLRRKGA